MTSPGQGKDEDFGRGDSAYDHYYSDPHLQTEPDLAPLAQPPFYAIKDACLATWAAQGQACAARRELQGAGREGIVVDGLYAPG